GALKGALHGGAHHRMVLDHYCLQLNGFQGGHAPTVA
ncbi:MAG: hypothetical protein QOJ13_25, partial [Gaiellales bacterium]|nr:hypothetical protein [Gaiellales bacterium]